MKTTLILTCAGKGERAGFDKNKLLVSVNGSDCFCRTLSAFLKTGLIDEYIFTASETDFDEITNKVKNIGKVVLGGSTRTESVKNALKVTTGDIVLIHDGARPFVTERIIKDCINNARTHGGTVTAVPSRDTIMGFDDNANYIGKNGLYQVQTPQAFKTKEIIKAYELAGDKTFNDDGEVYNEYIGGLTITNGDNKNVKITFKDDFELLNCYNDIRCGVGFDCHRLVENRKLILGGIEIPHDKGLLGHSDADVLTHAVMDAILSACSLRDIGYHFPDTDNAYLNANSMMLLDKVLQLIKEKGYKVKSLSAVIMAEKPKLKNYIPAITKNLADAIGVDIDAIGIGATTLEGRGFVGREEAICVNAQAVIQNL